MKSIDEIMDMLDWNNDEETQKQGVELGKQVKNFNVFILPCNSKHYSKNIWDNCAEIICSKTLDEIDTYLYEILTWVQDLNWPGAFKIMDKMKEIKSEEYIASRLDKLIKIVEKIDDEMYEIWLENLREIKNS